MPRKRTTGTQASKARSQSPLPKGLKKADLVDYYTRMVQARSLDERI